jgi:iron complex outermembrane recepter protein
MIRKTITIARPLANNINTMGRNKLVKAMLGLGLLASIDYGFVHSVAAAEGVDGVINGFVIEEVVITARKRQESLQDAPLSVAAFTGDGLEQRGITDVAEVAQLIPNLVFDTAPPISGNSAAAAVFIRGVGQLDFTINVDPGVGTYIDGVYVARSVGGVIDLLDLERIEVLRGPQGTLFGRNTIGGAIQLISKAPDREFGGYVATTLGSDSRIDLQGVINVPITDDLLSKFSVLSRQRDGYVTDGNGTDLGNDDSVSARTQFVWAATDSMDFALNVDMTRDRENGAANVPLNLYADTPIPLRTNTQASGEGTLAGCTLATFNTSRNCFGPAWLTGDKHRTESTFPAKSNNDIYGVSLTVNYALWWADFKSITAYRDLDSNFQRDSDHSPFNVFATANDQQQNQFSQEFQLLGDSIEDRLHWVSGLYYFEEEASDLTQIFLPAPSGAPIIGVFQNEVENDNWALYGEATYDVTDSLHLTLGARYTEETKRYVTNQTFVPAAAPDVIIVTLVDEPGASVDFSETTSRATLSYDVNDLLMTYVTYSEGFKSGGFNPRYLAPAPDGKAIPYDPEYVTLYEAGFKYINDDNSVRVNGAFFINDYEDIQVSSNPEFTKGATITQNAAEAEISGMELEFTWVPSSELLIEGGLGYLNARYNSLSPDVQFSKSNEFARIPELSGNLAVSYIVDLSSGATVTPRIDWSYKSETQGSAENSVDVLQDDYQVINANVAYQDASENWLLSLGVSNLTDEDYLISANENQRLGYAEGVFARDREWYLKVRRNF